MKRVQRVEDSLAQSGARSPSVLPAENMAKPIGSRKNTLALCRRFRFLVLSFPRRDRPKETRNPEMNLQSPITAQCHENALKAIPTHGGIETQHPASRFSFPDKGKETGVNRTPDIPTGMHATREPNANIPTGTHATREPNANIPTEPHATREPNAKRPNRTTHAPQNSPARTDASAGTRSGQHKRRAGAQFTNP